MPLWRLFYTTILDALFPLSPAEAELAALAPENALKILPQAPAFGSGTVALPTTVAIFAYKEERVAKLVWGIKYKKSAHAVRLGGYAMWSMLTEGVEGSLQDTVSGSAEPAPRSRPHRPPKGPSDFPSTPSLILVPMPITLRRRRERGYNQCELLADEIKRLDTAGQFILENNLLIRTQHMSRQTLKGRSERLISAKGIFLVNEKVVQNKDTQLIVIDDVITTGSTMKEAIDTLQAAGFKNVRGISLAH